MERALRTPRVAADEVLAEVSREQFAQAKAVIDSLLAWSDRHQSLVTFDETTLQHPRVGFNAPDGQVVWLSRRTFSGDAMIEILTRTGKKLPEPILNHLKELLHGIIPDEALDGNRVIQVSTAKIDLQQQVRLLSALDFALGAVIGLAAKQEPL